MPKPYSEFADTPSENAKLKAVLSQEVSRKKQIELERDALQAQYKKIRSDKREFEVFTKKRLVATRDRYMRELQVRGNKLKQKQMKIDATCVENAEIKSLLAKKEAENERVASAKETLEASNKKLRSSKRKLEEFIKKRLVDDQDRHLRGLKLKQLKIDVARADNAKLKSLLAKKEAEIDRIANANKILESQYKRVRSDKTKLEAFTKKSLADSQENVVRGLRKCSDKLKQKQIKIDEAFAEIAELKSLLAKKEDNIKVIIKENDVLKADYKKSRRDQQELAANAKKVHAENCKLKRLLAKKEAKNNQITKENDILENGNKRRRSAMQAPVSSKHNNIVLKERNVVLK
ncbi:MAG: hypothetical protein SGBAC_011012 [Bacillariaceae sp.]